MNFLRVIPFVLLNLKDADQGGGAGGSDNPPPTEPQPTGDTVESKLASAIGHIKNLFTRVGQLTSQLATANSEKEKLQGQFTSASAGWEKEKEEHGKTKGLLSTANTTINGLTKERDDANSNVTRLEKLCGLHGVDYTQAAPVPANNQGAMTGQAHYEKYCELKQQETQGKAKSGSAFNYWKEHKDEIEKFAASRRE